MKFKKVDLKNYNVDTEFKSALNQYQQSYAQLLNTQTDQKQQNVTKEPKTNSSLKSIIKNFLVSFNSEK